MNIHSYRQHFANEQGAFLGFRSKTSALHHAVVALLKYFKCHCMQAATVTYSRYRHVIHVIPLI